MNWVVFCSSLSVAQTFRRFFGYVLLFRVIENILSALAFECGTVKIMTVFRIDRNQQHFSFHIKTPYVIYLNIAKVNFRFFPNIMWDIFITKKLVIVNSDAKLSSSDGSWKGSIIKHKRIVNYRLKT